MGVLRELGDDLYDVGIARVGGGEGPACARATDRARRRYAIDATRLHRTRHFERGSGEIMSGGHCYGLKFEMSWALKCCSRWDEACAKAL